MWGSPARRDGGWDKRFKFPGSPPSPVSRWGKHMAGCRWRDDPDMTGSDRKLHHLTSSSSFFSCCYSEIKDNINVRLARVWNTISWPLDGREDVRLNRPSSVSVWWARETRCKLIWRHMMLQPTDTTWPLGYCLTQPSQSPSSYNSLHPNLPDKDLESVGDTEM